MQPRVTIIMPSLNVAPYIRECMDSVINQTLNEIEILCVDAGSTDGTLEILEAYAAQDHRIKIIHSDKKSYGYQVNLGFDAAQGEYIGIVETDDYIVPDMYETLVEVADRYQVDILRADFHVFEGEGPNREFRFRSAVHKEEYYNTVLDPFKDNEVFKCNNVPWSGVYRTAFLREKNIRLNESAGASYQDNGLWWQTFTQTHRVMFLNESFYRLRRDNPNSSVNSKAKVFCMCEEYDFIRNFLHEHPELEKRFAALLAYYRMENYYFTLERIAPEFKKEFLRRFSKDFKKIEADGELDRALYNNDQWRRLHEIMYAPDFYHFCRYNRFGWGMYRALKKIPGGIRCLREHGLRYTVDRGLIHLHLKEDKGMGSDYEYYSNLPPSRYPGELKRWYRRATGNKLNLKNPQTFNEKIQWMKLYDATPLKTRLADKYLVREWVKEKIGEEYLVPLLGVWDSFDEIDFDSLPDRFALKANHGSGWNIIVKDKSKFDREAAKAKFDRWMKTNFAFSGGFEMHYMNIPPKIIAEKYIENVDGLKDYRFYCFNGKPCQVWVDIYSGTPNHLRSVFDMDWNPVPLKCTWPEGGELLKKKPASFDKMKEFAAMLCQDFAFVRVDFFDVDGKLYMGEMTFTPMSGQGRFEPPEWDLKLGEILKLPPKSPT